MDIKNYYFISNVKLALKVNGKTYYATTNKNGKAKFNVSKWKAGNYKAYINILNNYKSPTQKILVKDRYAIEPCAPAEDLRMVIIGTDLNEKYLHKLFVQNERLF